TAYAYFVSPLRYRTPDKQCGPGRYRGLTAFASLSMAVSDRKNTFALKYLCLCLGVLPVLPAQAEYVGEIYNGEDMIITTAHKLFPNTTIASPKFEITEKDIEKINASTATDLVRNAPGIQVRRRFIGDTNGVVATRGSTNFQTAHTMLFQDGIPLSNIAQTKWNGAPRWNLIASNSVESIDILYGPFSAEYSGNSFGSVINVKTKMPEKFSMHMDVMGILQPVKRFGRDDTLWGHKEFISAGNRFDDVTVFGFYNHLENQGQPQMWDMQKVKPGNTGTLVTGGQFTQDNKGNRTIITGDSGIENTISDLYSLKIGYDFTDDLRGLFTIAFEDFERNTGYEDLTGRNYLKQANGLPFWGNGTTDVANQNGFQFTPTKRLYGSSRYAPSKNQRQTLSYGLNLSGQLNDDWSIDTSASFFDAYKDHRVSPTYSPLDPLNNNKGTITDKKMWWTTFDFKLATQNLFGNEDLGFMWGYHYNQVSLNIKTYKSNNIANEIKYFLKQNSGGKTEMHSGFAQIDYQFLQDWNVMVGGRLDSWTARNGHDIKNGFGAHNLQFSNRDQIRLSPKFSLAWEPGDFTARYSFSRAYRFALVGELFASSTVATTKNISDPGLGPENGNFHNLTLAYNIPEGMVSMDVFYNQIKNEIMNTKKLIGNSTISTFFGIGKTETVGVQMSYRQDHVMGVPIALDFNATWLDKTILDNPNNPALSGKQWVRTSHWKVNAVATWHTLPQWDNTVSFNYRGPQFATETNSDNSNLRVYGSSSEYHLLNFKSLYKQPLGNGMMATVSLGIDNLLDENYYDYHPYPQRTYFVQIGLDI
uniref:TonB-dependent receptor n=2 Tax=Thiolapillus sp. TaxID=2017437 RepID=UPI002600187E